MSREVDQKVVEMRFDNKQFEENVKESMSTLEKLKNALKFDGATKGLENIEKTSSKINMSSLTEAAETVKVKFSAMEVIAITALSNITNKAIDAGEKIVKSLTIDNISAGFEKYTMKTSNVQTLVNSTGKSVEEIEKYLEKLMWYSDETSYGFTDMTSALATMSASGGDIEKLIPLMMGVANATAFAGKGAAEFSQIMQYSINQAYSAGYMQLQDWKTIESRTVNSKQLIESLILSGEQLGRIKKGQVTIENFRESLKKKWVDREVMESGFGSFAKVTDEIYKGIQNGVFNDYAEGLEKIGNKFGETQYRAAASAQEAKSYREAMDAIKDGISSQWSKMFEAIFGGYDKARKLWTDFYYFLYEVFQKPIEQLSEKVQEVMAHNPYTVLLDKLKSVSTTVEKITDAVVDYENVVNRILKGEFGTGQSRWDKLTKAGYDWAYAQNLVNEKLGDSTRHATQYSATQKQITTQLVELSDEKLKEIGLTEEEIKMYRSLEAQSKKTGKSINELIEDMKNEDGRSLLLGGFANIGESILTIIDSIKKAWSSVFSIDTIGIYNIIKSFNKFTEKLIPTEETAKKITTTFKGLFDTIDLGLKIVLAPLTILKNVISSTSDSLSFGLFDITAKMGELLTQFHDWVLSNGFIAKGVQVISNTLSHSIKIISKWINEFIKSEKVHKIISNIFNIFRNIGGIVYDILVDLYKGTKNWFNSIRESETGSKIIDGIRNAFSKLGDILVAVTDKTLGWLKSFRKILQEHGVVEAISKALSKVFSFLEKIVTLTWNWAKAFAASERGQKILSIFSNIFQTIWSRLKDIFDITVEWIEKIVQSNGFKNALDFILDVFTKIWEIGKNIIDGLYKGLSDGSSGIFGLIRNIASKILETFKNILGIHSPSKKFYEAGANCMEGFINGISDFFKGVIETVKRLFGQLADFIINIDWTKIITLGISVATILAVKKLFQIANTLVDAINNFSKPAASFAKLMDSLTENIKGFGKAAQINAKSEFIKSFSKAILLLTASIFILTQVPTDKLWVAIGAITVLTGVMSAFLWFANSKFMSGMDKGNKNIIKTTELIGAIIGIASAVLILSIAMNKLASIDSDKVLGIISMFSLMIAGLWIIIKASSKISDPKNFKSIASIGSLLLSISTSMIVLAFVAKILSGIDNNGLKKAGIALGSLSGAVALLLFVCSLFVKNGGSNIGKTLLEISLCMGILTIICKMFEKMSWDNMAHAGVGLLGLIAAVTLLLIAVKAFGGNRRSTAISKILIEIAICFGILSLTAKMFAGMSWEEFGHAAAGLGMLVIIVGLLLGVVKLVGGTKGSKELGVTLIGIALVMAAMAACCVILGIIDPTALTQGVLAVSVLTLMMAILVHSLKGVNEAKGSIAAMTAVIIAIAASALVLSFIPFDKLGPATAAISIMLGMVALVIRQTKNIDNKAIGSLVSMVVVIAILSTAVILLAKLTSPESAIASAGAIVILLGSLTAIMYILSKIKVDIKNVLLGVVALISIIIPILALVGILYLAKDINNAIDNAIALAGLATVLTLLLGPLTLIGLVMSSGIGAAAVFLGVAALLSMSVPLLALVGVLALMEGLTKAKENTEVLTELLTVLVGALVVIGLFGPLAIVGEAALLGLIGIIGLTTTLVIAIGALFDKFPSLEKFIDKGLPILEKLAIGLGKVLGGFIKGALSSILGILPELGMQLSTFMVNLTPFIVGAKMLDDGVADGIKSLASALLVLTGANLLNQLTSWLTGGNDLAKFGEQIAPLGEGIAKFSKYTEGLNGKNVKNAAQAGEALAKMASNLPNSGGWIGSIMGENDADEFGNKIASFGKALAKFAKTVSGIKDFESITLATKAGKALAKMADDIPNMGGVVSWFAGENDLSKFGKNIVSYGKNLIEYYGVVKELDENSYVAISNSVKSTKELIKMSNGIENIGGLVSFFTGDNDLKTFGKNLVNFGESLVLYANKVNDESVAKISSANENIKELVSIAKSISDLNIKDVTKFGSSLEKVAKDGIELFKKKFDGSVKTVTEKVNDFISNVSKNVNNRSNKSKFESLAKDFIKSFVSSLKVEKNACTTFVNDICSKIKTKENKDSFASAGKYLVVGFVDGINNGRTSLSKASISLADTTKNAIKKALDIHSPSRVMYGLGSNTVKGFINALNDYTDDVFGAGYGIADSAKDGITEAIQTVNKILSGEISDNPTIRPVLDLSNVEHGVRRINGIFSSQQAFSVDAAGTIGIQNGLGSTTINMTINAAPGQDVNQLADIISKKLNDSIRRRVNVWK